MTQAPDVTPPVELRFHPTYSLHCMLMHLPVRNPEADL
jgi:hypothetical protein